MMRTALLACAMAAAGTAGAADQPTAGATRGHGEPSLRDEVYEVVDAYVLMKAQERLGLTDEQFAKLVPLIKKQKGDRREFEQRRYRALHELREQFTRGEATEARVGELLRELKAVENDMPAQMARDREAIDAILSPVQQAKYRLLDAEVDRRLHELREQARERHRGEGGGRRGPGGPGRGADPAP